MLDHIPEVMEPKSEDIIDLYNFETEWLIHSDFSFMNFILNISRYNEVA